jgi:hypothetical protein
MSDATTSRGGDHDAVQSNKGGHMRSREELIGAEVLALVDRFHGAGHHRHHQISRTLRTAVEALALMSLAHQLAPSRSRRLALATQAYLKHERRRRRH